MMKRRRVLYAEDEFTNRKLIEIQLKHAGVSCDTAIDGLEAVEKFKKNSYDLVLLDQYMPGLNGNEVAKIIQKSDPDMPLIAITGDEETDEIFRGGGFREVIHKPLRGKGHIDIILKYLP
jgi:CheY-like chemotaxis protein